MKDTSPVVEIEASDRIAQEREATKGRAGTGCHDGDVRVPTKAFINEHPKVADSRRLSNPQRPAAGNLEI